MSKLERVISVIIGMALCVAPTVLRLTKFQEDTEIIDGEFWGLASLMGLFFGSMLMWCAICGQRLFDEVNDEEC